MDSLTILNQIDYEMSVLKVKSASLETERQGYQTQDALLKATWDEAGVMGGIAALMHLKLWLVTHMVEGKRA